MIYKTNFKNLIILKKKSYKDKRGYFKELLLEKEIKQKFPFVVMSFSRKNVLRGLHIQNINTQGKYISVIKGKVFDVVVDLRRKSETFGKTFSIILSEENNKSLYIPAGFAHGFCALNNENYIVYSCTNYRDAKSESSIQYNDENLKIKWPIKKPIVSIKDKKSISFNEYKKKYL
jgi:dTDP-4-dehydrorhamnose 3,5-epimerase|tara:strand:- start:11 stop:535 length:525 start_codon:yes stop_codon:yes gene_type:complete